MVIAPWCVKHHVFNPDFALWDLFENSRHPKFSIQNPVACHHNPMKSEGKILPQFRAHPYPTSIPNGIIPKILTISSEIIPLYFHLSIFQRCPNFGGKSWPKVHCLEAEPPQNSRCFSTGSGDHHLPTGATAGAEVFRRRQGTPKAVPAFNPAKSQRHLEPNVPAQLRRTNQGQMAPPTFFLFHVTKYVYIYMCVYIYMYIYIYIISCW